MSSGRELVTPIENKYCMSGSGKFQFWRFPDPDFLPFPFYQECIELKFLYNAYFGIMTCLFYLFLIKVMLVFRYVINMERSHNILDRKPQFRNVCHKWILLSMLLKFLPSDLISEGFVQNHFEFLCQNLA